MRGDLCEILMERASDVTSSSGDVIESITETGDSTEVTFRDADAQAFDLVIGADGLHSNVRRIVFGDESQFLRDLGMYLCVYSVPNYARKANGRTRSSRTATGTEHPNSP